MDKELNEQDVKDFLLKTDFRVESGYSYTELLDFLENFKYIYRQTFEEKRKLRRELEVKENVISNIMEDIEETEHLLNIQTKKINNLYKKLNEKLSWKERLKGKIKL